MKRLVFLLFVLLLLPVSNLKAQSVDLLYHGKSYTPPFYKGASLWGEQGIATLLAVPQGLGNPATLNYRWTKNGTVLGGEGGASGVGKNSLTFADSLFSKPVTIEVEIVSANEDILATNSVTLTPQNPTPMVYENNPLYGLMFHQAVGNDFQMEGSEVTFDVFPFFSDAQNRTSGNMIYQWKTNAGEVQSGVSVTYRVPEEGGGSSAVSINISNPEKIMSSLNKSFLVQFGQ